MGKHQLEAITNGKFEEGWGAPRPDGYEVQLQEPLNKSLDWLQITEIALTVKIALDSIGFTDWARDKIYDGAWDYIKNLASMGKAARSGSICITSNQATGGVEIEFKDMTPEAIERARIEVKQKIEANANGSTQTNIVKIKL